MGPVSSNGSIPGLDGKILVDPNTLRNMTSESVDNSCIMAWVSNIWVSGTWLRVLKALTASSSLKSMMNCAMADREASVRDRKLVAGPSERQGRTWRSYCRRAVSNGERHRRNKSSPQKWPTMTIVGQRNNRQCRQTVLTDDDDVCQRRVDDARRQRATTMFNCLSNVTVSTTRHWDVATLEANTCLASRWLSMTSTTDENHFRFDNFEIFFSDNLSTKRFNSRRNRASNFIVQR